MDNIRHMYEKGSCDKTSLLVTSVCVVVDMVGN